MRDVEWHKGNDAESSRAMPLCSWPNVSLRSRQLFWHAVPRLTPIGWSLNIGLPPSNLNTKHLEPTRKTPRRDRLVNMFLPHGFARHLEKSSVLLDPA